jgi:hypothetical protein
MIVFAHTYGFNYADLFHLNVPSAASRRGYPFLMQIYSPLTFRYIENLRARNRVLEDHIAASQHGQNHQSP